MTRDSQERGWHEHLQALFLEARALGGPERAAFLARACGADLDLRRELEALLTEDASSAALLEEGSPGIRRELEELHDRAVRGEALTVPDTIGEYRILGQLGEGGMGTVYAARHDRLQRTVALKVLRPGTLTPEAARRFAHEGEMLGRLQHPGIACIYESGSAMTELGRLPYFAMERVDGSPLTRFAEERGLDVDERLALLAQVADAVDHAHRQGVVHRDLKPDNILVDHSGQPKILDFGIARVIDSDVQRTTRGTGVGQILGTLAYMSPEQARGDSLGIDSRSDVYTLGVLLHELLTGRLPHDVSGLSLPETLRVLQEEEPPRLGRSHPVLRGDVETIVRKAMDRDRERRYPSAAALASDIRRFLRRQPIQARPASAIYTLGRFVQRHRTGAVATLLVALSLVAGLVASLRFGLQERQRRQEVMRLSALQVAEELVARADGPELWPLHPDRAQAYSDWIDEARALVAELPRYRETLAELRRRGVRRTPEELAAARPRHPRLGELERLRGRARSLRNELLQVRDGRTAELPILDPTVPEDPVELHGLAFELVNPMRRTKGQEPLGLALALRAHERSSGELREEVAGTLAWAYLSLGRVDEAAAVPLRPELGPPGRERFLELVRTDVARQVARRRDDRWVEDVERRLRETERELDSLREEIDREHAWHFPDDPRGLGWWHDRVEQLVSDLESLEAGLLSEDGVTPEHGWSVPKRLRWVQDWRAATAPRGDLDRIWAEHLPAIRAEFPGFRGPQLGLVPLGRDPRSGLWEFAHLPSGDPPSRSPEGELVRSEGTGLVLVLLRGGEFWMGANHEPGTRNHHPDATDNEGPPHRVRLSPFLVSKYEMTQGQWLRLTGTNPSRDTPLAGRPNHGSRWNAAGLPIDLQHPVDSVPWADCERTCWRFGLALPTEARWEYAARGGTDTTWWTGDDPQDLATAANLADDFALPSAKQIGWDAFESWDDGHLFGARVGSLDPNPFGLHDVAGNVREWCQDSVDMTMYFRPHSVDPVADDPTTKLRMTRGGGLSDPATKARSSKRWPVHPGTLDCIGLRPARDLDP